MYRSMFSYSHFAYKSEMEKVCEAMEHHHRKLFCLEGRGGDEREKGD